MELPGQDPDQLLRAIRNDASTKKSGKLKIFFGYAAGVGKTYAMLQAAHQATSFRAAAAVPLLWSGGSTKLPRWSRKSSTMKKFSAGSSTASTMTLKRCAFCRRNCP